MPPLKQIRPGMRFLRTLGAKALFLVIILLACIPLSAGGVGYAFSGGGARGFAQLGILKVLEENGVYPDYISGVSMGALVGGLYAMGYSASEVEVLLLDLDFLATIGYGYQREDLYIGQKRWPSYGNLTLSLDDGWTPNLPTGLFIGNKLSLELADLFAPASGIEDFDNLPVGFNCLSTDLVSGELVVFDSGSLMQAVRASVSIPSVMAPFEFNGRTYVDGGLLQNMPIPQVIAQGADAVIGLKVNSKLRTPERLGNLMDILDQTINIGMTQNINEFLDQCDLLMEPQLGSFTSTSYNDAAQIIAIGEEYARANLDRIIAFRDSLIAGGHKFKRPQRLSLPDTIRITQIEFRGNRDVSPAQLRNYLDLDNDRGYSSRQIADACLAAWNSQLFDTVYPVLEPSGNGYRLVVFVRESERRELTLNLSYTTEEELNVGAVLTLNNLALKNSKLMAGLNLGGRTEVSIDYVKNFGEFWGSYFRLFPYLSEHRLYLYDSDYNKISSVKALEYGIVPGVGVFANRLAIAEGFFYSYRTKLYRDVSATAPVDSLYLISGFGLKLYHESLNDDFFPQSGARALAKFNFARWPAISDQIYSRFTGEFDVYARLANPVSLRLGLDYGNYFGSVQESSFDPFYFSGSQGYKGYQRYAISSPQFKIYTAGLIWNPANNLFLETGVQGLNTQQGDPWGLDQDVEWCLYGDFGYRSVVGPLKFVAAVREHGKPQYYLNIGFDTDLFWFSRK